LHARNVQVSPGGAVGVARAAGQWRRHPACGESWRGPRAR